MTFWIVVAAAAGLCAGALVGHLLARAALGAELASTRARLDERTSGAARAEADLRRAREEMAALQQTNARLAERAAFLEAGEAKLRETFQALSAEVLKQNSESFLTLAKNDLEGRRKAIDELVKPLRDSVESLEKQRIGAYARLDEHLRALIDTQGRLQSQTTNLVQALRAPSVRGRWGEIQLRRVIEMAGMLPHCDFDEQQTVTTEDGRLRPDVVVRLPGKKSVVVDAKTPLAAYLQAIDASDEETRASLLRDHARQVRDHVGKLAARAYWDQFKPGPEFVVMFLPGETFFSAALQHDPGLIESAVKQRVVPASPTTLIALLLTIAYAWNQERLADNAQRISDVGRELYERVRVWTDHLGRVGKGLETALGSYNEAIASLEKRVLVSARRLKELGAATGEDIAEVKTVDGAPRDPQVAEEPDDYGKLRLARIGDEP